MQVSDLPPWGFFSTCDMQEGRIHFTTYALSPDAPGKISLKYFQVSALIYHL